MQKRVEGNSDLMERRKTIVEHPFGTIKHWNKQRPHVMKWYAIMKSHFFSVPKDKERIDKCKGYVYPESFSRSPLY
jgi:hypothetical protein